jgi:hypothetical protein
MVAADEIVIFIAQLISIKFQGENYLSARIYHALLMVRRYPNGTPIKKPPGLEGPCTVARRPDGPEVVQDC